MTKNKIKAKPLISAGPMEDCGEEEFLDICKVTDADPVAVAMLTGTNIGYNRGTGGNASNQGRTKSARRVFREYVRSVIGAHNLPHEATKELVRAARNKVLTDALRNNDGKLALEATKVIGSDQEIFGAIKIELKTDALNELIEKQINELDESDVLFLPESEDEIQVNEKQLTDTNNVTSEV